MSKIKIFVAGHKGMVGSGIVRVLKKNSNVELITVDKKDLNLINQVDVENFFKTQKIHQVYLAAAKVGGIHANNTYPADFIYQNLMIQSNIVHSSFMSGVKKLLFLGSSCIYPKQASQPLKENQLLTGLLEPTNEPYAIAKIAGIKLCESYNRQFGKSHEIDYRSIMPTNLYGPGDNFDPENSHVIPGLIYRFHQAKVQNLPHVIIWGSGTVKREFLFVDDMVSACIQIMNLNKEIFEKYSTSRCSHINVGSGFELTISELSEIIKKVVGYKGKIEFDKSKPDGSPRKLVDSHKINEIGFKPKVHLEEGIIKTYNNFLKEQSNS